MSIYTILLLTFKRYGGIFTIVRQGHSNYPFSLGYRLSWGGSQLFLLYTILFNINLNLTY